MNQALASAFHDELEKLSWIGPSIGTKPIGKLPTFEDIKPKKAAKPAKAPGPRQPGPSPKVKIERPGTVKLRARIEGERKAQASLNRLSTEAQARYHATRTPSPAPNPLSVPKPAFTGTPVTMNTPAVRAARGRIASRRKIKTMVEAIPGATASAKAAPPKWTLTGAQRTDKGLTSPSPNWRQRLLQRQKGAQ